MNNRTLGTLALICSPALLVEAIWTVAFGENDLVIGLASFFFMVGWAFSNLGMQQMQAIGTGLAAKIVLRIQLVGVVLAIFYGIFEATKIVSDESLLFTIADLCWPLSMVFMIVVGIMAIRAKRWAGWQRFIPLICALWLPASIPLAMLGESNPLFETVGILFGFGWTAVAWCILALIVRSNATLVAPTVPDLGGNEIIEHDAIDHDTVMSVR